MAATTVIVQHRDGSPARKVRVCLSFQNGGGSSEAAFTNHFGEATIRHSRAGLARVIVSGAARATVHCPGTVAVTI